ncbi:MAG: ATP-binding cassette domain-containing protein [Acidobacteria bacterium]|nr:ATP-binding cassette domain-containing protein [Acidobacteriota bacterium]
MRLLEYENVTIYRGDRIALDGVTFSLDVGEHVAILGPNGCGKSTLIKTMTRECYPYLGAGPTGLRIMGRETWSVFDLRVLLGIVTNDQVAACTRHVTGRETVLSGFFSSVGLWPHLEVTPAMERKTDEILALLEIPHLAERYVDEISSGEARRLVIGRALVHDPKALVLDEPTNSLDVRATYELRDIVRKIARAGTTIVLVTHHLPDIVPEIDRVILLRAGRIVRDGRKPDVLTPAALTALFGVPLDVEARGGYYQIW